ncbi:MAG TPA: hypothetical protein VH092_06370 [Urbifossiella sp.]|nr:hypothetical protein [Urbifossiella sp.]
MGPSNRAEFEELLADCLNRLDGAGAAALLPQDPKERFGRGFNRLMAGVDAAAIDVAYLLPLAGLPHYEPVTGYGFEPTPGVSGGYPCRRCR